jgi:hypothetical protein
MTGADSLLFVEARAFGQGVAFRKGGTAGMLETFSKDSSFFAGGIIRPICACL